MNKNEFLLELERSLAKLPDDERADVLRDFEEHFTFGIEEGKSEEEISRSLGTPQQIAKELLASYHIEQVETKVTAKNLLRAIWAVISLGFFNVVIVLGPFIGLVSLLFSGWVVSVSFVVSPLLVLFKGALYPETFAWFELFFSMVLAGLGIFLVQAMYYVTKKGQLGLVKYLKYNVRIVKGGLKHE